VTSHNLNAMAFEFSSTDAIDAQCNAASNNLSRSLLDGGLASQQV
jgi:hypothetical protein